MVELPRFGVLGSLGLLLVALTAGGLRSGYLVLATDNGKNEPAWLVQGSGPLPPLPAGTEMLGHESPTEQDNLIANLVEHRWFGSLAPLATEEEQTSHVAPGYSWTVALLARFTDQLPQVLRWANVGLGTLACCCYFFFALLAFRNIGVATLAGMLCALHPFWILATAETVDATLASFLLAACLMLGTKSSQDGGAFTSLLFGLSLAGLAMVRAALFPFTLIAFLWFLWRCRLYRWGWFAGLLAILGYANGLAPWAVRNYQLMHRPIPIVDSAYLHLWIGNNPKSTGGTLDEATLRSSFSDERLQELLSEKHQARRYDMLSKDLLESVKAAPLATVTQRFDSANAFFFGELWAREQKPLQIREGAEPLISDQAIQLTLTGTLLGLYGLALLGWRSSYRWGWHSRLGALAALWIPLPYILSHAEALSGPRLPFDGILLCYAAFALFYLVPGTLTDPDPPIVMPGT